MQLVSVTGTVWINCKHGVKLVTEWTWADIHAVVLYCFTFRSRYYTYTLSNLTHWQPDHYAWWRLPMCTKFNQVNLYQELSQSMAYWDIQLQHHVHEYKWRINYQSHCECSWVYCSHFQCNEYNQTKLAQLLCHRRSWSVVLHLWRQIKMLCNVYCIQIYVYYRYNKLTDYYQIW